MIAFRDDDPFTYVNNKGIDRPSLRDLPLASLYGMSEWLPYIDSAIKATGVLDGDLRLSKHLAT